MNIVLIIILNLDVIIKCVHICMKNVITQKKKLCPHAGDAHDNICQNSKWCKKAHNKFELYIWKYKYYDTEIINNKLELCLHHGEKHNKKCKGKGKCKLSHNINEQEEIFDYYQQQLHYQNMINNTEYMLNQQHIHYQNMIYNNEYMLNQQYIQYQNMIENNRYMLNQEYNIQYPTLNK
jgi:hypothetical protein